jgi:hypothetical protein
LRAHIGLIDADSPDPGFRLTEPLTADAWTEQEGQRVRDPAGEYFPVVFLDDGDLGAVLPIQASERGDGFSWLRIAR